MSGLRDLGMRAGQEVAVIGCDDIPIAAFVDPPLTTFGAPLWTIGRMLVDLLEPRLGSSEVEQVKYLIVPEVVEHQSQRSVIIPARLSAIF